MNFIKECQVNVAGKSNGLTIPSGFRIGIIGLNKEIQKDNTVNVIFEVHTYEDDTHSKRLVNDDVTPFICTYNMTKASAFTTTDQTLFNNTLKTTITDAYGASNVVII